MPTCWECTPIDVHPSRARYPVSDKRLQLFQHHQWCKNCRPTVTETPRQSSKPVSGPAPVRAVVRPASVPHYLLSPSPFIQPSVRRILSRRDTALDSKCFFVPSSQLHRPEEREVAKPPKLEDVADQGNGTLAPTPTKNQEGSEDAGIAIIQEVCRDKRSEKSRRERGVVITASVPGGCGEGAEIRVKDEPGDEDDMYTDPEEPEGTHVPSLTSWNKKRKYSSSPDYLHDSDSDAPRPYGDGTPAKKVKASQRNYSPSPSSLVSTSRSQRSPRSSGKGTKKSLVHEVGARAHIRPEVKAAPKTVPSSNPAAGIASASRTETRTQRNGSRESYRKHPVHWAADGSLLVQSTRVRYFVHRSRWVKASAWLRDVLEGENTNKRTGRSSVRLEHVNGTPLVRLDERGVRREDWEALLDAMDGAISYVHAPPPLSTIASILRAAHLLKVQDFEIWARGIFVEAWKDDLPDAGSGAHFPSVRSPQEKGGLARDGKGKSTARSPTWRGRPGEDNGGRRENRVSATEALITARMCNTPGVVKRAMWELVRSENFGQGDDEDIVGPETRGDEPTGFSASVLHTEARCDSEKHAQEGEHTRQTWTLPQNDFRTLTMARTRLIARWMRETGQFPEELLGCPDAAAIHSSAPDPGEVISVDEENTEGGEEWYTCTASDPNSAREAHRRLVIQSGVQEEYMHDVLGGLAALGRLNWGWSPPRDPTTPPAPAPGSTSGEARGDKGGEFYGEFCDACVAKMTKRWGRVRKEVWEECDELFGVAR